MITIKVKGLKKLNQQLLAMGKIDLSPAIMKATLRVERDAKIMVPVDTGALRTSITHVVQGNVGIVGTSIEYAAKVELGIGQRRQPYLTPALNMNRDRIKQDIMFHIRKQANKIRGE